MKKILTLLTICALPLFAGAQETAPTVQIPETTVQPAESMLQTEQADSQKNTISTPENVSSENNKEFDFESMPTSHFIGCAVVFVILAFLGIKLRILKVLLIFSKIDFTGGSSPVNPAVSKMGCFIFYLVGIFYLTALIYIHFFK